MEEGQVNKETEVAPALIAVHPSKKSVAIAVGPSLRVFDLHFGSVALLIDDSGGPFHRDSIRAIRFGSKGPQKRVSAFAISNDGSYVCLADKFGVVWVVDLAGYDGDQPLVDKKATPLLSHYCSIITNLEFSNDGQFIVNADRDLKSMLLFFPTSLLSGAHEIQSFCLGHTEVALKAFSFGYYGKHTQGMWRK